MARTELVAVRFDPKTKYLLDIAARVQRRSVANYVEWAVEDSFRRVDMGRPDGQEETVEIAGHVLWSINEIERLMRLSQTHPNLLTFEEQHLVKLAHEATVFRGVGGQGTGAMERQSRHLEPHWETLKQAAVEGLSFEDIHEKLYPPLTEEAIDAKITEHENSIKKLKATKKDRAAPAKKAV